MKIADFVILAIVIIALIIALWYNHKDKKNGCSCGCSSCPYSGSCNKTKKRGTNNES
ncbi:MAG: FeoB-associated Cys-rich membrane protein [Clostridia bacterium]|nr:FeoB-associated Cys-rich membrane protein [Clostridia bacterium]